MNIFKSKTIDFNGIILAIFAIVKGFGIEIPEDVMNATVQVVLGLVLIVNFVLRFFTDKPLSEK